MYGILRFLVNGEALVLGQTEEDFGELVGRIVVEMDGLGEAALQSGVGVDEVVHLVGIASHDADELAAVVLQSFQQRVDSLATEAVVVTRFQGIGLVDEQHAA